MFKSRYGQLYEINRGQEWRWEIENWSHMRDGKIMDSELLVTSAGVAFHFHLTIDQMNGEEVVGFYIHHKARPIPKYTFAVGNTKGRVVRQQTAHTIPKDTKRCGHQKVCSNRVLRNVVDKACDDICVVWFRFDTDRIASNGNLGEFMWNIPDFTNVRVGPYTSKSFFRVHEDDRCTVKLDVDPHNRANVIPHISQRQQRNIPCTFKFHTPALRVLHTTEECSPGKWPSVPYATLCDLDQDKTLLCLITFLQVCVFLSTIDSQNGVVNSWLMVGQLSRPTPTPQQAGIKREERVPVTDITAVLPPPGQRRDADGEFDNMDDDNMEPGGMFTDDMSDDGEHGRTMTSAHPEAPAAAAPTRIDINVEAHPEEPQPPCPLDDDEKQA